MDIMNRKKPSGETSFNGADIIVYAVASVIIVLFFCKRCVFCRKTRNVSLFRNDSGVKERMPREPDLVIFVELARHPLGRDARPHRTTLPTTRLL